MANRVFPEHETDQHSILDYEADIRHTEQANGKQPPVQYVDHDAESTGTDSESNDEKKTGTGEYMRVVRPGEQMIAGELSSVDIVYAKPALDSAISTPDDRLSETSSRLRSRISKVPDRVGNMSSTGARPKYQSEVIGADNSPHENSCCAIILTVLSYILVIMFFPVSLCATIKVVQEYERAVIFRLGRLLPGGAKGPGIFFVMPCIEEYSKVDLRTVSFDVPPQEVLTRDSVTVSVDAVVYYRISSPTVSVANVENAANSTQLLAQTTLRNVLGTQNLSEILSNREHISEQMQNVLDDATDKWGIKVERVEIKDVRLPTQLQRAMAAEAEAARDARAKVIAAEGEQKASIALKEAADVIGGSSAALQLRYLQTLNSISAEKNSTIIFPVPIDLMASFIRK